MTSDGFEFKDPARKQAMTFAVLPAGKLEVVSTQRKKSEPHVKRIIASIEKVGFVAPVVVVPRNGRYIIIDGQHRFLAAQELGLKNIPAIVVPESFARRMLTLNVEKEPNIRERSYVALAIYREMTEAEPKLNEDDEEVLDAIDHAHYVTLGMAYESAGRLTGSAFEPILKKCDGFLDDTLAETLPIREARAAKVVEAYKLVKAISDKLKEMDAWHEFVNAQVIAYANPLKRMRKQATFDDTFDKLLAKLAELEENPKKLMSAS